MPTDQSILPCRGSSRPPPLLDRYLDSERQHRRHLHVLGRGVAGIDDANVKGASRAGVFHLGRFDFDAQIGAAHEHLLGRFGSQAAIGERLGLDRDRARLARRQLDVDAAAFARPQGADAMRGRAFRGSADRQQADRHVFRIAIAGIRDRQLVDLRLAVEHFGRAGDGHHQLRLLHFDERLRSLGGEGPLNAQIERRVLSRHELQDQRFAGLGLEPVDLPAQWLVTLARPRRVNRTHAGVQARDLREAGNVDRHDQVVGRGAGVANLDDELRLAPMSTLRGPTASTLTTGLSAVNSTSATPVRLAGSWLSISGPLEVSPASSCEGFSSPCCAAGDSIGATGVARAVRGSRLTSTSSG